MDSPLTKHEQDGKPSFLDVTPERLSKLTASQLADDMERALDFMSDETYDDAVIDAYLEALDRVAPMPEYPDAATTYAEFRDKIRSISEELAPAKSPAVPSRGIRRGRQLLRTVLVAAVLVACLFSGMVVAQASGLDVFGAIARWTADAFSFGDVSTLAASDIEEQLFYTEPDKTVPEEYKELQTELKHRGFPLYFPEIPEGFELVDNFLYVSEQDGGLNYSNCYLRESDMIGLAVNQNIETPEKIYEKDDSPVEEYLYNGVMHYLFTNLDNQVAVWIVGDLEYSISTTLSKDELKELVQSVY
ncbi:DUF4367 domain-containing protein [Clostridium sp.]|uniref:DUF4367 domain-containing protein n=1 Tax=Clostridium sp. TaxID=1506 RepID=UPI003078FFFF